MAGPTTAQALSRGDGRHRTVRVGAHEADRSKLMAASYKTWIIAAAAAVIGGSLGPSVTASSAFGSISVAGTDGDGVITAGAGVIALLGFAGAGLLGAYHVFTATDNIADVSNDFVRASVGWGLWLVVSEPSSGSFCPLWPNPPANRCPLRQGEARAVLEHRRSRHPLAARRLPDRWVHARRRLMQDDLARRRAAEAAVDGQQRPHRPPERDLAASTVVPGFPSSGTRRRHSPRSPRSSLSPATFSRSAVRRRRPSTAWRTATASTSVR